MAKPRRTICDRHDSVINLAQSIQKMCVEIDKLSTKDPAAAVDALEQAVKLASDMSYEADQISDETESAKESGVAMEAKLQERKEQARLFEQQKADQSHALRKLAGEIEEA